MPIENILLWAAVLMLLSVISSKLSDKFAIPALVLFLGIGMLAGSEGLGGIYFNDPWLAKSIGIVALIFIIYSGGLNTKWKNVRPILGPAFLLSTIGVVLTAVIVGVFAIFILKFSLIQGMLLGAIISSTDAAAVFTILRSKRISLKGDLSPLLELESGSNDPMAVFLTIGFIRLLTEKNSSLIHLFPLFLLDMCVGALVGYLIGKLSVYAINRVKLEYAGLYPVLTIGIVMLTYALATVLKGNGILAVYLVGLIMGNRDFINKRAVMRFHEGLAWLTQIVMFLTLGLLVFPSHLLGVIGSGLLISVVLMFLARPISVLLCLIPFKFNFAHKTLISWVGLRGAVPIILATFPLLANIPQSHEIFNIVFFVVVTSVLIQGTSIPWVSKFLNAAGPTDNARAYPIELEQTVGVDVSLNDFIVPFDSAVVGKKIFEINTPVKCLIALISRGDQYIVPNGSTTIEAGDVMLALANKEDAATLQKILAELKQKS